jgi:uncharacterized membrane protein YeaQ/YmgE (transglycosylase-associated protein family)
MILAPFWCLRHDAPGKDVLKRGAEVTLTVFELLILLIVAALCGSLGMAIGGYSHGGCLISVVLGFIGAFLGMWMARALSLPEILMLEVGDARFPIIWSIIGSALFVAVISFLTRAGSRPD